MAAQGGYGVVARINTGSMTAIVGVLGVEFPKFTKFMKESTGHDATSGYYTATPSGKRRLQPFRMRIAWDTAEATHAQMVTSFNADTAVTVDIADPDGDEVISFSSHIEEIGRISEQEGILEADILVHPSGPPTIT